MKFSFRRALKYIFIVLAGLLIVLAAASSLALALIDKTQVTAMVARMVKEKTGRDLTVNGNISTGLGLYPTLKVEDISISNIAGAKNPRMAEVKSLEVGLALLPLLHKQISIHHIMLKGVMLSLEENAGSKPNWEFSSDGKATPGNSANYAVSIDSIKAEDVTVTLRNGGATNIFALKHMTLTPGKLLSSGASFDMEGAYNMMPVTLKGKATFSGDPLKDKLGLEVSATLANDARIFLTGLAYDISGARKLDFTFTASGKNLAALNAIGVSLPPTQNYKIESRVKGSDANVTFTDINLTLDGHNATGELRYTDAAGKPSISGSLRSPKLIINLPEENKETGGKDSAGAEPTSHAFNALRTFDADIQLAIDTLTLGKQSFDKLRAHLRVQNGQLRLEPFSAALWDGTVNGALTASNAGISSTLKIADVSAERAFRELDITRNFTGGIFKSAMDVSGQGSNKQSILSTLQGNASFFVGKGSYKPDSALAQVAGFVELLAGGGRTINVNCLVGEFDINGGVAHAKTLVLDTDRAKVTGTGSINLGRNSINMVLTPEAKTISLAGLALPVRVEGALDHPHWYPDPAGTVKKVGSMALDIAGTGSDILGAVLGGGKPNGGYAKTDTVSPCDNSKPAATPTSAASAPASPQSSTDSAPQQKKPSLKNDVKNLKQLFKF